MKSFIGLVIFLNIILGLGVSAQIPVRKGPAAPEEIKKAREELNADFNNPEAHKKFMKAMGIINPELVSQYRKWNEEYPGNITIPLTMGTFFYNAEMPQAKEFLLKATEIDSGNAKIWNMLFVDARIRGEKEMSEVYIKKAMLTDTSNLSYRISYIYSLRDKDYNEFKHETFDFLKRYPENPRCSALLYLVAKDAQDSKEKIKLLEELRRLYSPKRFSYSASGTEQLVDIYMQSNPEKALAIINESGAEGDWKIRKQVAEALILINKLEDRKDYSNAVIEINKVILPRWNNINDVIAVKKSSLLDKVGSTNAAYDSLAVKFAKVPTDKLYDALEFYGKKMGKSNSQIEKDIAAIRNSTAVQAHPFDLGLYTKEGNLKLEDLKGKVILLTFWFPYCSPCREEFPYFQNVINKFNDDQVAYIGINIYSEQDDFVQQFLQNYKYSFIPLRGSADFETKYFGVSGAPQNFVIDMEGRIIFKGFQINENNERTLELMISGLLKRKS